MFRSSVNGTGCPLHSTDSPSLPFPCVTVCHQISTEVYFSLVILVLHMQSVFIQPVKMAALSVEAILLAAASATSSSSTRCSLSPSAPAVGCNQPSDLNILKNVTKIITRTIEPVSIHQNREWQQVWLCYWASGGGGRIDIFVNCSWVDTRWQQDCTVHIYTQTVHRTTQNEQHN